MKKLFVSLAMLSTAALLFTACNKNGEEKTEETAPAATIEEKTVEPVKTEEPKAEEATEPAAEKAAEGDTKADTKTEETK